MSIQIAPLPHVPARVWAKLGHDAAWGVPAAQFGFALHLIGTYGAAVRGLELMCALGGALTAAWLAGRTDRQRRADERLQRNWAYDNRAMDLAMRRESLRREEMGRRTGGLILGPGEGIISPAWVRELARTGLTREQAAANLKANVRKANP